MEVSLGSLGMLREGPPPRPPLQAADRRGEADGERSHWLRSFVGMWLR